MNAANEAAVAAFIDERIRLTDIPLVIEAVMDRHSVSPVLDIETVLEADKWARLDAAEEIERICHRSGPVPVS